MFPYLIRKLAELKKLCCFIAITAIFTNVQAPCHNSTIVYRSSSCDNSIFKVDIQLPSYINIMTATCKTIEKNKIFTFSHFSVPITPSAPSPLFFYDRY